MMPQPNSKATYEGEQLEATLHHQNQRRNRHRLDILAPCEAAPIIFPTQYKYQFPIPAGVPSGRTGWAARYREMGGRLGVIRWDGACVLIDKKRAGPVVDALMFEGLDCVFTFACIVSECGVIYEYT